MRPRAGNELLLIFALQKSGKVSLLVEDSRDFRLLRRYAEKDRVGTDRKPSKTWKFVTFPSWRRMAADTLCLELIFYAPCCQPLPERQRGRNSAKYLASPASP